MPFPILAGLEAIKGIAGLFKKRGKPNTKLDDAISVVDDVVAGVHAVGQQDPEAIKILKDHELEMEKAYTEQAKAAFQVMDTEAKSEDAMVRRARPTFLYCGYAIMLFQFICCPLFGCKISSYIDPDMLKWFYEMFTAGFLGYGALRTYDKHVGARKEVDLANAEAEE